MSVMNELCRRGKPGVSDESQHSNDDQLDRKRGLVDVDWQTGSEFHCLILGFATEYSTSVRKFTATYVNPIARMQPWTR